MNNEFKFLSDEEVFNKYDGQEVKIKYLYAQYDMDSVFEGNKIKTTKGTLTKVFNMDGSDSKLAVMNKRGACVVAGCVIGVVGI